MNKSDELIAIYRFDNTIQADALLAMLKQEGILVIKRLFEDLAYNGIYRPQHGMGELLVRREDLDKAKTVVNEFEQIEEKIIESQKDLELKDNIAKKRRKYNIISALIVIPIFLILGIYVLLYSKYKILSFIFLY